jgi:hypothetical protein
VRINRRQALQAAFAGAVASAFQGRSIARADGASPPSRIVFYVQPHGHIPNAFDMEIPGGASDRVAERSLVDLAPADFSSTLRPLHPFRDRLLAIEGLSHTSALADIAAVMAAGTGDLNNHQIGVADVLTGTRALQRSGTYCTGGSRSLDQELAVRLAAPGRFDSRVYGYGYIPNSIVSPFSYLGPGRATPMVSDPAAAFADLLGYMPPSAAPTSRDALLRSLRPSVLDAASREYELLAPRLGAEGREKLEQHRDLVRELEASLGAIGPSAKCTPSYDKTAVPFRQLLDIVRLAFACDLTRVVTLVAPVPLCPEIGYPADMTVHTYAHQSIEGNTSCGQAFNPVAAQAMTDLDAWHANHFAYLLAQLDSVVEGSGTLLDHTVVVWLTELATPTHQHHDACTVLAGGCNGFFRTGRYVRYPRTLPNPIAGFPMTGPPHNRLLVSLLEAMGQPDDSFGMTSAVAADGTPISFRGPLTELHA